ncbi:gluconate 2-dehydrogenase subunit 3 family protein [Colwelliaceae bacterium 6471]
MNSFFDGQYQVEAWYEKKLTRRSLLKSAAGAAAIAALPVKALSQEQYKALQIALKTDPWLTLDAVLDHLLPASETGPSAKDIKVINYLYNVIYQQPTDKSEIDFIYKGVGWLNDFSQSQYQQAFVTLGFDDKERLLKAISQSRAGDNWLNNLVGYIFEAMLSPPSYGGNPNGIGWQWLNHQAGFPLPEKGQRYFEIPGFKSIAVANVSDVSSIGKTKS